MVLSDELLKNACPKERDYKIFDGKGLYILIKSTGSKLWRFKYRFNNVEKSLSLGAYPEISITQARALINNTRLLIRNGHDPSVIKKANKTMQLRSPIKILRNELKHLEEMAERLTHKKNELNNALEDVMFDLNEITSFIEELRMSIKYLEGADS